jgi:hypothetical protein
VLLRLAYLSVTNVVALLRLLPVSDRDKDVESLALRHQITVLERQLGTARPRFLPSDRAFPAALLHRLPRDVPGRFRLLIRPDRCCAGTGTCWHAVTRPGPAPGAVPDHLEVGSERESAGILAGEAAGGQDRDAAVQPEALRTA